MKLKVPFLIVISLMLLLISSCKEEPPVTQETDPELPSFENGEGTIEGTVKVTDPNSEISGLS